MKTEIHPEYVDSHVTLHVRQRVHTRSTQAEIHVEVCSNCHPFYTGKQKLVDTGGRIDRFKRRAAPARRQLARAEHRARRRRSVEASLASLDASDGARVGDGASAATSSRTRRPVGGQAVLEGVMMRGVSTWAVAVRKPLPEQLAEGGLEPEEVPLGEIEVVSHPLTSVLKRHRVLRLPLVRGVVALGESLGHRLQGAGHLRQRAAARGRGGDLRRHVGRHVVLALVLRDRPVLRRPGRADEPDQGPARLLVPVLAGRGRRAHRDLPRLPAGALAPARPAPRLRVPRRRAQDDLLLRGRPGAHARPTRSASAACTRAAARASCSS